MSEQMRAEFSKHCQLWRYSEEVDEDDFFINVTTQRAWDVWFTAWKASRQALVDELPEPYKVDGNDMLCPVEVDEALENAGIKTK